MRQAAAPMIDFTLEREVRAPIDTVFARLTDHREYARMTPLRKSTLERPGAPDPNGLGAVRALGVAGPPMREEVTAFEPPNRFAYKMLSGLPVRDHVGDVRLEETPGGTRMTYRITSYPTIPGTAPVLGLVLKQAIKGLMGGVAKAAERSA